MSEVEILVKAIFSWVGQKGVYRLLEIFKRKNVKIEDDKELVESIEAAKQGVTSEALVQKVVTVLRENDLLSDPDVQTLLQEAKTAEKEAGGINIHTKTQHAGNVAGKIDTVNQTFNFDRKS